MNALTKRFNQYGTDVNTHDLVKFIAIVCMSIAHLSYCFEPDWLWLRALGRVTFPALFFLVGFAKNYRNSNYLMGLAFFFQYMNVMTFYPVFPLNILFAVIVCRVLLQYLQQFSVSVVMNVAMVLFFLGFIPQVYIATNLVFEYGIHAIEFALLGYFVRRCNEGIRMRFMVTFYCVLVYVFYVVTQNSAFDFDTNQSIFVWVVIGVLMIGFLFYKVRTFALLSKVQSLASIIKFLSRYSLEYYVIHRTIFQILSLWINVSHSHEFKWLLS